MPTRNIGVRQLSSISAFQKTKMGPYTPFGQIPSQRFLSSGARSAVANKLLATLEDYANKYPDDANFQNRFYKELLRQNMGAIVVDRYQTGQFASNSATEALYQKAIQTLGGGVGQQGFDASLGNSPGLNNHQIQAIGQAVAANSIGGNVGVSRGNTGNGARASPLYVVVEETIGSVIFKWVKMIMYFGLTMFVILSVLTFVTEQFGGLKKMSNKQDNEAKAEHQKVRFSDVHGCDEAKEELQELVDFLKNPDKFSTLGGKLPKGVLLVGPPGTGKTLLARAVAGEAGVPFFFMSGSEFDEIYVGVGAKRVRELFANAKDKSPAIIFIDELDAIGGKRNPRDATYVKQTLNQLLTELDGFEQNTGVIILAATNFPELLDKALTRPGRFDRNVVVGLPDVRGRMAILNHHVKNIRAGPDVDVSRIAQGTPGFSGAELENIVNQAAVHASKAKAQSVSMKDFEWAKDKILMGAEKRSMVISEKEKLMTAYHEAGHALAIMFTQGANKLHKITIMPRGQALGVTSHLPEMDKYSQSMNEYKAQIDVCLGGKVAEDLVYGSEQVTSGVASDLQQATAVAYAMVTQFGMSEKLGNVDLRSNFNQLSPQTKQLVEVEVRRLIEEGRTRVKDLIISKRVELDRLAKALVDYETLDGEEAFKVIKGEALPNRELLPSGGIKRPSGPEEPGNGGMAIPAIPGSAAAADEGASKPPPASGVVA